MKNFVFLNPVETVIRAENELVAIRELSEISEVDYDELDYLELLDVDVYFWLSDEEKEKISFTDFTADLLDVDEVSVLIVGGERIWIKNFEDLL